MQKINDRLSRWHQFVEKDVGSFLFYVNFPLPEAESQLPPEPPLWPDRVKERIERWWAEYEIMRRKAALVDDDRVPYLKNTTGTEIFAEAFGCKVHRPEDTNPFALPLIHSAAEADKIKPPELSASSLAYLFDIADELYRRGGPDAVMKLPDIQSPMDIVALIWDKTSLFCAMAEAQEAVKSLAEKVQRLLAAFFEEWCGRYGKTFVAHYPDYVMHGGITLSVDEVGAVSPEMFDKFFREELTALGDYFGGLGLHCCAEARHQWNNFRSLSGLKVINHNAPPASDARDYILDAVRFYSGGPVQVPKGWTPEDHPETWPKHFPDNARLVFEAAAENARSAAHIAERIKENRDSSCEAMLD